MKTIGPFDAIHFREIFASDCGDFSVKTQFTDDMDDYF